MGEKVGIACVSSSSQRYYLTVLETGNSMGGCTASKIRLGTLFLGVLEFAWPTGRFGGILNF